MYLKKKEAWEWKSGLKGTVLKLLCIVIVELSCGEDCEVLKGMEEEGDFIKG